MYTPVWFNHLLPNKPSTVMKDSRIQSPGASELTGNSKHNLLRRESDPTLLTDCIYLASIASFLIKKIILLEKSPQPVQNIAVSCYPNTAIELIPINCLGALVAFSSSLAGVQGWQIYRSRQRGLAELSHPALNLLRTQRLPLFWAISHSKAQWVLGACTHDELRTCFWSSDGSWGLVYGAKSWSCASYTSLKTAPNLFSVGTTKNRALKALSKCPDLIILVQICRGSLAKKNTHK